MVLIKDIDLFVRSWPLGRIIKTYPGTDGNARAATIKNEKGIYTRSKTKIVTATGRKKITVPGP